MRKAVFQNRLSGRRYIWDSIGESVPIRYCLAEKEVTMTYKIIEMPSGIGEVRKAEQHLFKVRYRIQHKENVETGQGEIFGEVTIGKAERMSAEVLNTLGSGQVFTLLLSDGRSLQVSSTGGDPLSGIWHIVNSSPEGFTPARH
jgi:hypothetical protein